MPEDISPSKPNHDVARLSALEAELAAVKRERDELKAAAEHTLWWWREKGRHAFDNERPLCMIALTAALSQEGK